jgi:dihydrolipoamide dehydrogenase
LIPAAIFTHPEAACVGITEDLAKENGIEYTCHKGYYRANGKAFAMDETDGMVKVLSDSGDRIIGCHVYGAHAADLVQEATALMAMGATVRQLHDIVHIHPTLSEILGEV